MSKFFTFSNEDYTKITYEDDCFDNNEFVNKLLEFSKFNNAKLKIKFESFQNQNYDIINNYDKMTNPNNLEQFGKFFDKRSQQLILRLIEDRFYPVDFSEQSVALVTKFFSDKNFSQTNDSLNIKALKTTNAIIVNFFGIVSNLETKTISAINDKYLCGYNKILKCFTQI